MKNILLFVVRSIFIFVFSILFFSLVEYYDLMSNVVVGLPILFIIRFLDLGNRDAIMRTRHNQVLIATFITTLVLIALFVGAYFIYDYVLNNLDIYKSIIEAFNIKPFLTYVK